MNLFDVYPLYEVTPKKAKDEIDLDENQNKTLSKKTHNIKFLRLKS